jgi:hypothetical protein
LKELLRVPQGLQGRLEKLVRQQAEALGTTAEDARRVVEVALIQRGLASLEQEEGPK